MTRCREILVCVALLASVTACGGAVVQGESSITTGEPTTTRPSRALPPRPRDIPLAGVDACQVLTDDQLRQLGYSLKRSPVANNRTGESQCDVANQFGSAPNYGTLITVSTSEDASVWLSPERQGDIASNLRTTIEDFPALKLTGKTFKDNCQIIVDVADGQHLDILTNSATGARSENPEPFCTQSQTIAEMAIRTLSARK
ncbi:DUF3558 domain-containing protein [Allokutzneria oryzae]|uniref:DUF3558 domain-containing protein n=1 Tax=Allokutzneria oryzae TaxID=1378989 RepID=A0ABV5ZUT2_9PSEU